MRKSVLSVIGDSGYRHAGDSSEDVGKEIESELKRTLTVEITVDHISGKESPDLMKLRMK